MAKLNQSQTTLLNNLRDQRRIFQSGANFEEVKQAIDDAVEQYITNNGCKDLTPVLSELTGVKLKSSIFSYFDFNDIVNGKINNQQAVDDLFDKCKLPEVYAFDCFAKKINKNNVFLRGHAAHQTIKTSTSPKNTGSFGLSSPHDRMVDIIKQKEEAHATIRDQYRNAQVDMLTNTSRDELVHSQTMLHKQELGSERLRLEQLANEQVMKSLEQRNMLGDLDNQEQTRNLITRGMFAQKVESEHNQSASIQAQKDELNRKMEELNARLTNTSLKYGKR